MRREFIYGSVRLVIMSIGVQESAGRRRTCALPRRKRRVNEVNCEEVACVAVPRWLSSSPVFQTSVSTDRPSRHYDDRRIVGENSIKVLNPAGIKGHLNHRENNDSIYRL